MTTPGTLRRQRSKAREPRTTSRPSPRCSAGTVYPGGTTVTINGKDSHMPQKYLTNKGNKHVTNKGAEDP